MMLVQYESKKALLASIGQKLNYRETSMFGAEYKADGTFTVARRPYIEANYFDSKLPGREFFAEVTMKDNLIAKVK